ncbi:hypothetical protein [Allomesorhizobium alhagi]|uniref:hypothetical protein n=1 Tax=Allomesorhizobium alhagi TaxID=475067 RepID=UPI001FCA4BAB|nr:hypothetical protein [Mesorhizobium alhagi]
MVKRQTTVSDFPVAPRRPRPGAAKPASEVAPRHDETAAAPVNVGPDTAPQTAKMEEDRAPTSLLSSTEAERRERLTTRALEREDSRIRLRDLKRARERESKHFVNVPLDYETKKRLEKAAHENDLKMTVIMKAAIDQYLRDNGY